MDYGKFRYQQRKAQRESAKRTRTIEVKSLRVRPSTDEHDLNVRIRSARKFLEKGKKVKFTVLFRGPEMRHTDIGRNVLKRIAEECADKGDVEQHPRQEGRQMHMLLTPNEEVLKELARQMSAARQKDGTARRPSEDKAKEDDQHNGQDEDQKGRRKASESDG